MPGVGTYNLDLEARLDAVLADSRHARQFDPLGATAAFSTTVARSAPLAVAQQKIAPAFSFASTVGAVLFFKIMLARVPVINCAKNRLNTSRGIKPSLG